MLAPPPHRTNPKLERVQTTPGILARGPWPIGEIRARWHEEPFEADAEKLRAADEAIRALRERGSPSHDGVAARLAAYSQPADGGLLIDLQPVRWALRLVDGDASDSIAALCVTRDHQGRWLAGRRAAWLSSWPGRWALGAGGAVDIGESPADTLTRELREEWSVAPERVRAEALVRLPHHLVMFVGMAWLPEGAVVTPDDEHDEFAWWPADVAEWPDEASEPLRRMAVLLAA
jgi:ADP-ribose pyrophosphatase YjhB (NUDIX family)